MFNKKLKEQIGQLLVENRRLKNELIARRSVVDLLEESVPKDQQERKEYVRNIAGFYGTVFKNKLSHLIYQQKDYLSRLGLTKQEEDIFRSNINCLNLIDDWFELRTNEHLGDMQVIREQLDDSDDFINSVNEKYL